MQIGYFRRRIKIERLFYAYKETFKFYGIKEKIV